MKRTLFLTPSSGQAGLTTIALGLVRALDRSGVRVAFCKPIGQTQGKDRGPERSTHFIRTTTSQKSTPEPISLQNASRMISEGRRDELMATVIREFHECSADADVVIIEGLLPTAGDSSIGALNLDLVKTLSAEVILVGSPKGLSQVEFENQLEYASEMYGGLRSEYVIGCIINKFKADSAETWEGTLDEWKRQSRILQPGTFDLIGAVPWDEELSFCRTIDIARHLEATVLIPGDIETRRVKSISLLARTVPHMIQTFQPGAVLVTPADRADVVLAIAMAALNKTQIAGLVLTGDVDLDPNVLELCLPAFETGLPLMRVSLNSYEAATKLHQMSGEVPADDLVRVQASMDHVAHHIDAEWLHALGTVEKEARLSPAAFCYQLTKRAQAASKRIVLPEGSEPRTVRAAAICAERGIARCILLGNPEEIRAVAKGQDIKLPAGVEILDANALRPNYVDKLVELRKGKNLSAQTAADQLEDNVMLGTVMLAQGEVDGLVSGAIHSSANTIRPALQIIKTRPGAKVVSSVFFMCLPDQVLVYGDCAVNTNPDAETLADIALQSAESAQLFGIPQRVAMISYSTGESGSGSDVDKVREATRIAREKQPGLLLDGPLQYDAAAIADVAATKAPNSPVAGKATVFVFPDLNTGNTTYKAVQRSANVISIGPMLQGLKRPVNDLSRGALVEDIVYTIAITAIQAAQRSI